MKKDIKQVKKQKDKQQEDRLVHGDKSCKVKDFLSLLDKACKRQNKST